MLGIGVVGVLLGWFVGYWLGLYHTRLYAEFYHFPFLHFRPSAQSFLLAGFVSLASALIGALGAVREAAALPPAEAMRPPAPPMFRRTALSRLGFIQRLDQPTRILLRQIARWPGRSFITAAGIAMSVAVLVTSMQWIDAINRMVDVYFLDAQAQDVSIGFGEPRSSEVERDIARLPGVMTTEPMRAVAAKMRAGSTGGARSGAGTAREPGVVPCVRRAGPRAARSRPRGW